MRLKFKNRKIIGKVMPLLMAVSFLAAAVIPSDALSYKNIIQIKGKDRYSTASQIAGEMGSYNSVILVNADQNRLADGLSASGLAGVIKAPILLVRKDKIPNETQLRMDIAKNIYIIGSENSISSNVEKKLKDQNMGGFKVTRIGGSNRFETSANVAKEILKIKGSIGKVFVTNGYKGEADAMSISAVAARDGEPVLLTNGSKLDSLSRSIVEQTNKIYAIGGENSITTGLVSQMAATRVSGRNRYATNASVVKTFYKDAPSRFYLSDAYKLVDALTGGPLAGRNGSPIVLVGNRGDKSILNGAKSIVSLGGISTSVLNQCVAAANK